jgi:hypothetical protein
MEPGKQEHTIALNRGLFLVRYTAAEDQAQPPWVRVSPDLVSANDIDILLHPDHREAVLWQPDTCLVVRALAASKLCVEVVPRRASGSVAATVRIEALNQGTPLIDNKVGNDIFQSGDLRILAHVAGIGDVTVNANEWLAGPASPSRIEGLCIDWPDKPTGLEIGYAVKTAKPHSVSSQKLGLGSFAGTRGKAMPIVGLMLELGGSAAADFQLIVEAIFLGAPAKRITGKRVVTSGPTGREPLVGLRIGVENLRVAIKAEAKLSASKSTRPGGRVRVFRSRAKQKQLAAV